MIIDKDDITGKIRTAIDDIVPDAADSFTDDTDAELWQATWHAVQSLLLELPLAMLSPSSLLPLNATNNTTPPYSVANTDGTGHIVLPDTFLRFVALQLTTWLRPVTELMETDSEEALSQTSRWGRGTPEKPRAMLDHDAAGRLILRYWTAGKPNGTYDHGVSILNHIPKAQLENGQSQSANNDQPSNPYITCALKDETERLVINRAASIFFEGKKEDSLADRFRTLSTI